MRIVGLLVILAVFALSLGRSLPVALDVPSAILVIGMPLGMLLLSGTSVPTMVMAVFRSQASAQELRAAAKGWRLARAYSLATGALGTLIGVLIILAQADGWSEIGPGLAVAILTVMYAVLLSYGLYLPLQSRLEDRLPE